ncbi:MAG: inorganic pyrophosphatase [Dysgonamonadaceae bacterium]|jgi:inorganic pyrophosphatase|nr:inorganic pyrophosphatase [Dysgonamonadaceae bacterium]
MYRQYKAHPWHGVSIGNMYPEVVTAYIEIVPTDTVKYEVDKESGYLSIDRPQKYSNVIPALYGFIPQTYSGHQVAELSNLSLNRHDIIGDNDPIDICVLTEKDIVHGDLLVKVRPIGGFRLIDDGQADDKIIAVLYNDAIYGSYQRLADIPTLVIERLRHYFTTYKDIPGTDQKKTELTHVYDVDVAHEVIIRAINDYKESFWKIG